MPANPLNPRQAFITEDVLRLEVETATTGPPNLVKNPSGAKGAWFWITPVANTAMSGTGVGLTFVTTVSQACYLTTDYMPVAATKYVASRLDLVSMASGSHNIKIRYQWFNAAKSLISTSTQSGALSTLGTVYGPVVQAPASTAFVKMRIDFYNGSGNPSASTAFQFRQAMVTWQDTGTVTTVRTNRVTNPSLETITLPWAGGTGANTTVARSTTQAHTGTYSLRATRTTSTGLMVVYGPGVTVTPGLDYTVSLYVRADTVGRNCSLYVKFYDTVGNLLGSASSAGNDGTGSWARFSVTATAPSGAVALALEMAWASVPVGEHHYLDACLIEQSTTLGSYFDGSTTDTGAFTYDWLGTAGQSQSTRTTSTTAFDYSEPMDWQNVLGPTHEITVNRRGFDVGTLSATVLDADLDPATASLIAPGKTARLIASTDSWVTSESLYEGRIDTADVSYTLDKLEPNAPVKTRITLTAVDNVSVLANRGESRGVLLEDLPHLLEDKGVPWSVNGSGNQVASADTVSTNDNASVLDQVAIARDTASGYAWVDSQNVLIVNDAAEMPASVVATFSADSGISYADIDAGFSTSSTINEVTVTWLRYTEANGIGTTEEVVYGPYRDQDSIDLYGARAASFTLHGDEDAGDIAAFAAAVLAANAVPTRRASRLTVPVMDTDGVDTMAALDLYDLAHVEFDTIIDDDYRVTGIAHSISPYGWLAELHFENDGSVATPRQTAPLLNTPTAATRQAQVNCSSGLTVTTTGTDVPGLTTPIVSSSAGDVFLAQVVLDVRATGANTQTLVANLLVAGVSQSSQLIAMFPTSGIRGTLTQTYIVTGLAAGSHTFKVQANLTGAGSYIVNASHSRLTVTRVR